MKLDNRGFTLTELIVCLVIFGIVAAAVFGFMLAGTNSYNLVDDRLELQMKYQLASNQIGDKIIDSNGGVYFDGDTLFVLNKNDNGYYTADIFELKDDGCIYYGEATALVSNGVLKCSYTAKDYLTDNVTSFEATPVISSESIASVIISLGLEKRGAVYSGEKTIALRNKSQIIERLYQAD